MLAKAFKEILPPLSNQQILEVTHLHSLANNNFDKIILERPFRAPHHNASHVSVVGGGSNTRPGEITLSHHGVLFLDEFPEFGRQTIEALRQPLEDHTITVARAKQTVEYPANFLLIATANPCPCGYYGSSKSCSCSAAQINHYQQKISGPILDRIDLYSEVSVVEHSKLLSVPAKGDDDEIRERVLTARKKQFQRFGSKEKLNSSMSNKEILKFAKVSPASKKLLDTAAEKLNISARAYMKLIKIARTIADLEDNDIITPEHISESLQYRSLNKLG